MPHQHTVTLIDGPRGGFDIDAEIDYVIHPASGDGWNEPREPSSAEIVGVTLYKVTRKGRYVREGEAWHDFKWHLDSVKREPLPGPVPAWVNDVLEQMEWWQDVEIEGAA